MKPTRGAAGRTGRSLIGSPVLPAGVVLIAVIAMLTSGGRAARAQDDAGATVFQANCAGCHQADGSGLPGTFPPLAGNPAAADRDVVVQVVTEGKTGAIEVLGVTYDGVMPPFTRLSADEINAVADYVVGLASGTPPPSASPSSTPATPASTPPPAPPTKGDPQLGHDLFVGSRDLSAGGSACSSCHTAGDVGHLGRGGLGPDLSAVYGRLGGESGLTAWLANPASPTMQPVFADRPMTDAEIADLVAFLADAPERDRHASVDWLAIVGVAGLAILLAGMAAAWRGMRAPYAKTLAASTRSAR
jgi:mono/diheme cytochrome c family protein